MSFSFLKKSIFQDLLILFVLASTLFGAFLGARPLANPDEGRYAEIPREMLLTGDFITPRLNGVKYFEKPVLFYWMEAFSLKLFGINEGAARLIPMLLALLGVFSVYLGGRFLFSQKAGFYAALTLMTSCLYFVFAHIVALDMPLTFFLSGCLLSFITGFYVPPSLKRRALMYLSSACLGLAFLTKGVVSLGLAGPIIVLWLTFFGLWRKLWPIYLPTTLFVFLSIVLPWHILVSIKNPEFLWFYFVKEHFLRYTTTIHGRHQPFWFFVPVILCGLFPWVFYGRLNLKRIFPLSWRSRQSHEKEGFFLIWFVFTFLFFSLSNSKLIPYALPLFPPLSLLLGIIFSVTFSSSSSVLRFNEIKTYISVLLLLTAGIGGFHFLSPDMPSSLKPYTMIGIFFLWSGLLFAPLFLSTTGFKVQSPKFLTIFTGTFLFYIFISAISPLVPYQSSKLIALNLKKSLPPHAEILALKCYPPDLSFYLNLTHPITVIDSVGELEFGIEQESPSWMMPLSEFPNKWYCPQKVYAVLKEASLSGFEDMKLPYTFVPLRQEPTSLFSLPLPTSYVLLCNQ